MADENIQYTGEYKIVEGRMFKNTMDGRTVEVFSDGSISEDYEIGGKVYDAWGANFDKLEEYQKGATESPMEKFQEPEPVETRSVEEIVGYAVENKQERIVETAEVMVNNQVGQGYDDGKPPTEGGLAQYSGMDKEANPEKIVSDGRLSKFKTNYSGINKVSIKDLLNDAPKKTSLGGGHGLSGGHNMKSTVSLIENKENPFKQMLKAKKGGTDQKYWDKISAQKTQKMMGGNSMSLKSMIAASKKSNNTKAKRLLKGLK